ncbi:lipoprotein insertase outer membrane protein LolB [Vibrio zhugei]|uniref:Outer-membrane lipoprotein LolB n=1 Tax=Vibrio zhugei TaxID=2479546 RepID=A0ABV7C339_9VIBR|nr:lipoprotein insertase outer membrane protein LolB [Vibrio zhugei]
MRFVTQRITLLFSLVVLFLAGCSSVTHSPDYQVDWSEHQARLTQIDQYTLSGKMGYISPQQRQSMNFQWRKRGENTDLRLTNFLGQTVLHLTMTHDGATIHTYDDKTFRDKDAQALVARLTGLRLPIIPLQKWILGLPSDSDDHILNQNNTLSSLITTIDHKRWLVNYTDYSAYPYQGTPLYLPTRLSLSQGQIKLRIVISKWAVQ